MNTFKRVAVLIGIGIVFLLGFDYTKLRHRPKPGAWETSKRLRTLTQQASKTFAASAKACRDRTPSHSQSGEENAIIEKFFPRPEFVEDGFFIELGALDGRHFSNTNSIEHCYGWDGLLIEGNPPNAAKLFANKDRKVKKVHEAICKEGVGSIKFTVEGGPVAGAFSSMAEGFKKMWKHNETGLVDVPCRPLQAILDENSVSHVDFFSLDVEGAELKVLETIDFSRTTIDVLIIEMDEWDEAKNEACRAMLRKGGMCLAPAEYVLRSDCWVGKKFKSHCV